MISLAKREAGKPIKGSIGCATFENMAVHKGVHHTLHSRNQFLYALDFLVQFWCKHKIYIFYPCQPFAQNAFLSNDHKELEGDQAP